MGHVTASSRILVVTGLRTEADISRSEHALCGGGQSESLARALDARLAAGDVRGVVSFGIAGGLDPRLATASLVIGRMVQSGDERFQVDSAWSDRLAAALPWATAGVIAGVDAPVVTVTEKARLHEQGACAVDMESHIAARLAAQHALPFAVLRVISDPAQRTLPPAALVGMRADGSTDAGAVIAALLKAPAQLPALIQTAHDAGAAFSALKRCRAALDDAFGFDA